MLTLSMDLPLIEVGAGEAVVTEGGASGAVWVLVEGALEVFKGDVAVNTITQPGAIVGEMSVLLGTRHGATVVTTEPTLLRYADEGQAFLFGDPEITMLIAVSLAERLNFVSSYLADLKQQYGDSTGLSMVSDVLAQLAQRQSAPARPGSARDPDPEY
jgi:CRP-like cAMP-binding protein